MQKKYKPRLYHCLSKTLDHKINNIGKFISQSSYKMPPMKIIAQNSNKMILQSFYVPAGFQLKSYAQSLNPKTKITQKIADNYIDEKIIIVNVILNHEIIKSYYGFFLY